MSSYRLIAATHTPFDAQGEFNPSAVERQAEFLLKQNVAGVFPGGTTGESLSLSLQGRLALGKQWVDVAAGTDLEVILHVGANALPDAIALSQQAGQIGAAGACGERFYFFSRSSHFVPRTIKLQGKTCCVGPSF
ncbi:dihydrodipicolinate synthase family protein [Planctomycetaceae bacterium]|nr:dihydrodipicolinate synthase family protein [Planctomycetaceae bacterium]